MAYMTDLKPRRKRRKRHCKYCTELFTPTQSSQQFCKVEHRLTYWRELQTAVSEPLFREFLEWRRRKAKKAKNAKQSRHIPVKAGQLAGRKPKRIL